MFWRKFRTTLITLCLASLLGTLLSGLSMRVLAQQSLSQIQERSVRMQPSTRLALSTLQANSPPLPPVGLPGRRTAGAGRGCPSSEVANAPSQPSNENSLTALMPTKNLGKTVATYPTFFFYIPQTSATSARFVLLNEENENRVYETTFAISGNPGIISISIPAFVTLPPLEISKNYHWYFHIICPFEQLDGNIKADGDMGEVYVDGWVQRVEPTPPLISQLEQASPRERVALYQKNHLWYDALATLAEQRRLQPEDATLETEWENLLRSVKLDAIVQQPLVGSLPSEGLD
ncbi:MAG: DUF928 domain-containing protein [Cyanobacteriota bacterium]